MIACKICGHETENSLQAHLNNKHNIRNKQYKDMYSNACIYSEEYSNRLKFTNKHRNPVYKKKLSESTKKLYQNPEWVKTHNRALKEGQNTPEAKINHRKGAFIYYECRTKEQAKSHRESIVKSWKDPQKREKRVSALKIAHNKLEVRGRHSRATKKFLNSLTPEERLKRNQYLKEIWSQPENREKILKISKIGLKAAMSSEGRKNFYIANKNPELREKRRKIAQKRLINQPVMSSLNKVFKKALNNVKLNPLLEYPVGPYVVDFCFLEERVIVEVDGDWWHANPSMYSYDNLHLIQKKTVYKDRREVTYCKSHHWTLIRFWEKDIKKDISTCIKQLQEVLYE